LPPLASQPEVKMKEAHASPMPLASLCTSKEYWLDHREHLQTLNSCTLAC
jgi:hypothetical protein